MIPLINARLVLLTQLMMSPPKNANKTSHVLPALYTVPKLINARQFNVQVISLFSTELPDNARLAILVSSITTRLNLVRSMVRRARLVYVLRRHLIGIISDWHVKDVLNLEGIIRRPKNVSCPGLRKRRNKHSDR